MSPAQNNASKTFLDDLVAEGEPVARLGTRWARAVVSGTGWTEATRRIGAGEWRMLGLWGEPELVHLAVLDETSGRFGIVSLNCPDGHYPSVSLHHPPAIRLERAANDLFGLEARGAPDDRPWLDHGRWGVTFPLDRAAEASAEPGPYEFLASEGPGLHQIAVGPVHAGVIEPGHFRFTVQGETIVRLEQRLGYTHKGIEGLMVGATPVTAMKLAGRVSGDSTVAYSWAFAQAVEFALGITPSARGIWLRALMAELERVANHLGDIGAVCNDAAFALMHAHCGALREEVLRTSATVFGHRLIRDRIIPGGVAIDLSKDGERAVRRLIDHIRHRFPTLVELYDNTASLQDRTVGAGRLSPELARQYAAGGYVGRASGRTFDARRMPGYAPYDQLQFEVPVLEDGDVNSRVWIRIREVEQSLDLLDQVLENLPGGPVNTELEAPARANEGVGLVEGFRGDILVWLRLEPDGTIGRCHLRDPSWFQWPLLEAAIKDNIVADFPLCNKSFNCSYSGHDL